MNIIGDFGRFLVQYQTPVGIVLTVILVAVAVFLAGKAVAAGQKKRWLLSQINDTVTEISSAVSSMNDRKPDVIYIDNRLSDADRNVEIRGDVPAEQKERADAGGSLEPDEDILKQLAAIGREAAVTPDSGTAQRDSEQAEASTAAEPNAETDFADAPKKFFSRDCAISKNGRAYTGEELEEQIKE